MMNTSALEAPVQRTGQLSMLLLMAISILKREWDNKPNAMDFRSGWPVTGAIL